MSHTGQLLIVSRRCTPTNSSTMKSSRIQSSGLIGGHHQEVEVLPVEDQWSRRIAWPVPLIDQPQQGWMLTVCEAQHRGRWVQGGVLISSHSILHLQWLWLKPLWAVAPPGQKPGHQSQQAITDHFNPMRCIQTPFRNHQKPSKHVKNQSGTINNQESIENR